MPSDRQTVASAYARADAAHEKIESHEELCAERYANIHAALGDLKGAIAEHKKTAQWVFRTFIAAAIGLIGWMGAQLYTQATRPAPAPVTLDVPR